MIISDKHKFIFVAVPKTGTTSIEKELQQHGRGRFYSGDGKHMTAAEVKAEVGDDVWSEYFTFAFVRHPMDWTLSWYTYRTRPELADADHPNHHRYTADLSFEEFLDAELAGMRTQGDHVLDADGDVMVDFLGRFENLAEDFAEVCRRVGLPPVELPARNRSPQGDYSDLYTDRARRLVTEANRREFELLDYDPDYRWQPRAFEAPEPEDVAAPLGYRLKRKAKRLLGR